MCAQYRWQVFKDLRAAIDANEGGLAKFSEGGRGENTSRVLLSTLRTSPVNKDVFHGFQKCFIEK